MSEKPKKLSIASKIKLGISVFVKSRSFYSEMLPLYLAYIAIEMCFFDTPVLVFCVGVHSALHYIFRDKLDSGESERDPSKTIVYDMSTIDGIVLHEDDGFLGLYTPKPMLMQEKHGLRVMVYNEELLILGLDQLIAQNPKALEYYDIDGLENLKQKSITMEQYTSANIIQKEIDGRD